MVKDKERYDVLHEELTELTCQLSFYKELSNLQDIHMTDLVNKLSTTLFSFIDDSNTCKSLLDAARQEVLQNNFGLDKEKDLKTHIDKLKCDRRECLQAREAYWFMKIDEWKSINASNVETEDSNFAIDSDTSRSSKTVTAQQSQGGQSAKEATDTKSALFASADDFFLYDDAEEETTFESEIPSTVTYFRRNMQSDRDEIPWYQQWKKRRAPNDS